MPDRDSESFLTRWSRLKRGEERPGPSDPAAPDAATEPRGAVPDRSAFESQAADEIKLEDLPNIDDLKIDSDISMFLRKGVPEHLQRLALRKAWSLDPAIRDFVEVAENQYDFNAGAVPGWGELPPDVDMKRLIAQAVGAPSDQPESEDRDLRQGDAKVSSTPGLPQQGADRSPGGSLGPADESSPDSSPQVPEIQAPERRKRHGGALPS
jgi:hypothetical protein